MKKIVKKKLKQEIVVVTQGVAVVAGVGGRRGRRRHRALIRSETLVSSGGKKAPEPAPKAPAKPAAKPGKAR